MYSEPNESEAATTWDTEVGTGLTATLDGGVLTISGDGAMDNYQSGEAPWDSDRASIISVVIEQGVTSIGDNAFGYCNNLKTVTIQGDVETIGRYAFECCSSLEIVTIQGDVETIGDSAFYECTSLTSVDIPDSVKTIGDSALSRSGLISITIPDKVTTLGDYAFYECTSLESVYMLGSIGTIGSGTFGYCSSLESVDIPDSVKTIGDYAFDACTSLTAIVIHDSVTIGDYAFRGCKSLETVTVTGGLGSDGKIVTDGVIDTYFKEGKSWTLRGAPIAVTSLTLEGISCREYNPDNLDRKGGIEAADDGRELNYEYDRFTWDSVTSSWGTARSVSGNLIINGGTASEENVTVSLGSSGWYTALTDSDGYYIIENVPKGISDYVTAEIAGYTQKNQELVTLDVNKTGQDLTLEINKYSVTLTKGTGSGGFTYKVSNESAIPYAVPFLVTHGDTLVIAALFSEEYAFDSWSGYSDSKINPLTLSDISGPVTLTASGELIEYYVTFGSGSDYTVYANGSPVSSESSAVGVTGGGSLSFSVRTAEGYLAVPIINGIAYLTAQNDGSYVISEIHSNLNVTVTVSPYSISDPDGNGSGNSSGNGPDASPGNSNGSAGDSSDGIPYWIPVLIVGAFLACIAAAAAGNAIIKRRKS